MRDEEEPAVPAGPATRAARGSEGEERASDDTLAIVAFAVGFAAIALSAIPFYGMFLAVPLGVVAVVLGWFGRRAATAGRGFATAGLATGAIALLVCATWIVTMVFPVWGLGSDTSIRAGETAVEHVHPQEEPAEAPDPTPEPDDDPGPAEVESGDPAPPADALEDASGEVELTVDGEDHRLELSDCTLGGGRGGAYLRGSGPDGRVALYVGEPGFGSAEILLVVDRDGEVTQVLVGEQRGYSASERSTMFDRRRVELTGSLRRALDDEPVGIELVATCS